MARRRWVSGCTAEIERLVEAAGHLLVPALEVVQPRLVGFAGQFAPLPLRVQRAPLVLVPPVRVEDVGHRRIVSRYAKPVQPEPTHPAAVGLFKGEALTLWRLRRDTTRIACFVAEWPGAFWLAVECAGGELLSSETLPSLEAVLARSDEARSAWVRQGWTEE